MTVLIAKAIKVITENGFRKPQQVLKEMIVLIVDLTAHEFIIQTVLGVPDHHLLHTNQDEIVHVRLVVIEDHIEIIHLQGAVHRIIHVGLIIHIKFLITKIVEARIVIIFV